MVKNLTTFINACIRNTEILTNYIFLKFRKNININAIINLSIRKYKSINTYPSLAYRRYKTLTCSVLLIDFIFRKSKFNIQSKKWQRYSRVRVYVKQ